MVSGRYLSARLSRPLQSFREGEAMKPQTIRTSRLLGSLFLLITSVFFSPCVNAQEQLLERATFPAQGFHDTLLHIPKPGRYSLTAQSPQGTALELIDHAAGCGYPEAQYYLGYLYQNGVQGVKQDYQLALHWYQKAAEKNTQTEGVQA